jgi:hypothetical protein
MRRPRRYEIWLAALVLSGLLVWSGRYFVNPDGVSYLDLSDDFAQGRWSAAVNAHWSPLYPLLLSVWLRPFASHPEWESTAVHILNGILFLTALATFEWLLRELRRKDAGILGTPEGEWAAYSVVLFCLGVLVTIKTVTPDMLTAAIVFAVAAALVRPRNQTASNGTYALLGALLGTAALAKSFMFGVSILILVLSLIKRRRHSRAVQLHLIAALVFCVITLPQLLAVSQKAGHLTFSDSGRLVYLLKVNRFAKLEVTTPPVQVLSNKPLMIAFPTAEANRTYPLWDEPAYWYAGTAAHLDVNDQLRALKENLVRDAGFAAKILIPLILIVVCRDKRVRMGNRLLILVSILVLGAYAMLYSEARLAGLWLALLAVAVLGGVTLADDSFGKAGVQSVNLITLISVLSILSYAFAQVLAPHQRWPIAVAQRVNQLGIQNDRVGLIGDESDLYWARLARVQVSGQIPLPGTYDYWFLSNAGRDSVDAEFASLGAKAVVAAYTEPTTVVTGWTRVPGTDFSIHLLDKR